MMGKLLANSGQDPNSLDAMQLDRVDNGGEAYDPFFQKNKNVSTEYKDSLFLETWPRAASLNEHYE